MPSSKGAISSDYLVTPQRRSKKMCAVATWYRSDNELPPLDCPRVADNETVWTVTTLPRKT